MSKRKHQLRKKMTNALVSIFALTVFLYPIVMSAKWLGANVVHVDPRRVKPAIAFQARNVDKTNAPLKPFAEPIVTIAFDDGWESVYVNAFPILQADGIHSTEFIITDKFVDYSYMSKAQLHSWQNAGNQVGSHTVSHPYLTKLSQTQLTHELRDSRDELAKEFGPIKDFTTPYGDYNDNVLKQVSEYYRSQKNAEGYITDSGQGAVNVKQSFNQLNYISYSVRQSTTLDDIKNVLKTNQKNNGWLVLTYHQVDNSGAEYSVSPAMFAKQLKLISDSNQRDATIGQVFDVLLPNWKAKL